MTLCRLVAQGLVPATAAQEVTSAVGSLLALQGQQVSAVPHALLARTPSATVRDVRAAFDEIALVRSWPMRGTVHITTAQDHHWLRAALLHRYDTYRHDAAENHGIDAKTLGVAAATVLEEIDREGPITRARAVELWAEAGLMDPARTVSAGASIEEAWQETSRRRRLVMLLHLEGILVQAPAGVNEHLLVDARDLPDETCGAVPGEKVGRGESGHEAALAEIARRFALGHGPVQVADLARWLMIPAGECSRALEAAVESSARTDTPVARMRLDEGGARLVPWETPISARERNAHAFYMRADLPELVEASRRRALGTVYLGMFDEMHVGYKDRSCLTDTVGENLICPAKNGMFRPFVVDRGRLVAVQRGSDLLWHPKAQLSARLEADVRRAVDRMTRRLSA
ncbi:winged helix DNA-binding domain-containing protein [Schaalia sp. 19OD2882]|nr:winged helix DNA-binding domain-containing protein [Schaalia sp. 19OD2882]